MNPSPAARASKRNPLLADGKLKGLSWRRSSKGVQCAFWRQVVNGRPRLKKLGEMSREQAVELIRGYIKQDGLRAFQERLGLLSEPKRVSTLGELFAAYRAYQPGARRLSAASMEANIGKVGLVVRRALGLERMAPVEGLSLMEFSPRAVRRLEAVMVEEARAAGAGLDEEAAEDLVDRAARNAHSIVQQARSLYSARARQSAPYEALTLPAFVEELLELRVGESTLVDYVPPPAEVVAKIRAGAEGLRAADPAAWVVMQLCANAGLRVGSALAARWDWFGIEGIDRNGRAVVEFNVRVAKGGKSIVPVRREVWLELLELRNGAEDRAPVVPGDGQAAYGRLKEWLRGCGLTNELCDKPVHALRKIYGDMMFVDGGQANQQAALGHSNAQVGRAYRQRRASVSVRAV